jgi:hypothetical protein
LAPANQREVIMKQAMLLGGLMVGVSLLAIGCVGHDDEFWRWFEERRQDGSSAPDDEGVDDECFGPLQSPELAYEGSITGCACTGDTAVCALAQHDGQPWAIALICDGQRWVGVEDGPCYPRSPGPRDCVVEGQRYAHGQSVPDPYSCNTCLCQDGSLAVCTEINCPDACPDGTLPATSCAACGPADGCEALETTCLPVCSSDAECTDRAYSMCVEGRCRNLCG